MLTTTAARVVAVVDSSDIIDTSTTLGSAFSAVAPRSAVSNGTNVWVVGAAGGLFLTARGATVQPTNLLTSPGNCRSVGIFEGQLYVTTGTATAGLYQVGSGLATTSTTAVSLVTTASPYGFAAFDVNPNEPGVDLIYLADDSAGIKRYRRTAGVWSVTPEATLGPAVRQMACVLVAADVVCVATNASTLYRVRDTNTSLATSATALTSIAGAPINTAFRGVAFQPVP